MLAAISNQLVRLLRDATGRGPTQGKTFWAGDELMMEDLRTVTALARQKHPGAVIVVIGESMSRWTSLSFT